MFLVVQPSGLPAAVNLIDYDPFAMFVAATAAADNRSEVS
jgi:hypothetical protein